jgi:hypothetical protein
MQEMAPKTTHPVPDEALEAVVGRKRPTIKPTTEDMAYAAGFFAGPKEHSPEHHAQRAALYKRIAELHDGAGRCP